VEPLLGSARMLDETGQEPAELRAAVDVPPGGTTAAAVADARVQAVRSPFTRRWPPPFERSRAASADSRAGVTGRPRPSYRSSRAEQSLRRRAASPGPRRAGRPGERIPRGDRGPGIAPSTSGFLRAAPVGHLHRVSSEAARAGPPGGMRPRWRKDLSLLGSFRPPGRRLRRRVPRRADRPASSGLDREWTVIIAGHRQPGSPLAREPGLRRPQLHRRRPRRPDR